MSDVSRFLYSPSEPRRGATFQLFFLMLAVAAVLGHRAYAPILLSPLAAIDWRHAWHARRATFRSIDRRWVIYFAASVIFAGVTALSALWSPMPASVDWSWRLGACLLIAPLSFHSVHYLTPAARDRAAAAVAYATVAMLILFTFEGLTDALIRRTLPPSDTLDRDFIALGRAALLLVLLAWPARRIFAERLKRPLVGWLVVAGALYPAWKFSIATNAAMLVAGCVAWGVTRLAGRSALKLLFVVTALLVVATPLLAGAVDAEALYAAMPWLPDSWAQRLFIWERAGDAILAHPFGGGVDYARWLSRPIVAVLINGVELNTMPVHPHNLFLHVWMDLGIVGAACLLGFVYAGWRAAQRAAVAREDMASIAAVVAALVVTAMTEWSVWQVWRFAAVWIALIALRIAASPPAATPALRPTL